MLLQCLPSRKTFFTEPASRKSMYCMFRSIEDPEGFMRPSVCTLGMYLQGSSCTEEGVALRTCPLLSICRVHLIMMSFSLGFLQTARDAQIPVWQCHPVIFGVVEFATVSFFQKCQHGVDVVLFSDLYVSMSSDVSGVRDHCSNVLHRCNL